jgi:ADP-ribose pyrophosphatase YjhB (NUDIX family)
VRVCAVLVHDGRLCLIRRQRPAGVQHSLPGGLVEDGEDPSGALRRELLEELALDTASLPAPPVLRFVQDQRTERPAETTPFRRRHLVFTAHLSDGLVEAVAQAEQDDPGQAPVVWLPASISTRPSARPSTKPSGLAPRPAGSSERSPTSLSRRVMKKRRRVVDSAG